jgi:nitrogen fixation/metabolism regulation signal transduction histidine kinase
MESWLESFARANFKRSTDTAHDLKTPLNVAVLNLELLRMRIRKIADGHEDEKLTAYAASIELELRRMARIFDAFFLLSTPPRNEGAPAALDVSAICIEIATSSGFTLEVAGPVSARAHESRIRQAFKMFFEGVSNVLSAEDRTVTASKDDEAFHISVSGKPVDGDFESTKIFKFYYTDAAGNPDLSLASARLIAETYGGELNASQDHDKVMIRLSFPLGEQ